MSVSVPRDRGARKKQSKSRKPHARTLERLEDRRLLANHAPAGANKTIAVLEDTTYTFVAADFGFTDPSDTPANNLFAVEIATLPAKGSLTDNGIVVTANQFIPVADIVAGLLKYMPAVNANGANYASLRFQVQDDGGTAGGGVDLDQSPNTITINVTAVNDAPSGADKTVTTLEDTAYTFTAADFGFTDSNDSPANTLSAVTISSLPTAGTLANNGVAVTAGQSIAVANITTGKLKFTPAANANGLNYASFTFQVQDNGGTANGGVDLDQTPNTITVNVTAVNDAPSGADKTVTTLEDTPYVFTTADFGFTDPNDSPANNLLTVKITTLPAAGSLKDNGVAVTTGQYVSVADITAGLLQYTAAANAVGSPYKTFTFQVQDDGGTLNAGVNLDASANTITINVLPVNDAPAGTNKTITTLEDTAYTFTAADFGFTDPTDAPANNLLAVKISTLPAVGTLTDNGVAVSAGQFVPVADITAGLLKFLPAANANGASYSSFTFQVQDNGGTANGGIDLDQSPNTITINVTAVNDAPSGTDKTVTTLEDTAYTFTAADFGFTDSNDSPANTLSAVKITTLPTAGTLTNNGVAVTAGQSITVANINSGLLKFTPAANANGLGYSSLTFQVQDNGGTANGGVDLDQSPNTITVNVTAVNDAPAGTNTTVTALEDTPYVFTTADFGFTDPNDSPANNLLAVKITTLPAAGSLKDNGVAVTTGQYVSVADITAGLLQYTAAANAVGSPYKTFTFQVQDDGGTLNAGVNLDASANTITINVLPVNDAPAGTNKTITTLEDTAYTFTAADFGFTDPTDAPANNLLAVKISTLPTAGTLTDNGVAVTAGQFIPVADITAGLLKFLPAANANGASYSSFTFQVKDDGGTANGGIDLDQSPNTITINVTAVNDAPSGADKTVTTLEDTAYTFTAADFGFSDPTDSPANTLLAVKITTLPTAGTLTNNGVAVTAGQSITVANINSGLLKFTPAANANGLGYASLTFQVQDNGGTANGGVDLDQSPNTITVNVTAVNDAPAGTNATVTTQQGTAYVFTAADFGFSDPTDFQANSLLAVKVTALPAAGSLKDNGVAVTAGQFISVADITAGLLQFMPAANGSGSPYASFTFQVRDDGGTANGGIDLDPSPNTIMVNVTPVNHAPAGADKTVSMLEDTTDTFTTADFGFSDPNDSPANSLLAIKISTLPTSGTLTDNGMAVTVGQFIPVADITGGLLKFTPAVNAKGVSYASFMFQVQDNGGTVNGGVDLDQSPNTITINVTGVNDAPFGADNTVTTLEDTAYAFTAADFGFSDPNDSPANSLLAVKVATLPTAGTLTDNGVAVAAGQLVSAADITAGLLKFTSAANANGASYASFTFQVQDDGGTANGGVNLATSPNTITINVSAINDAPTGTNKTVTTLEDTAYTFTTTDFGFNDPNDSPANSLLAVKVSTLPTAGTLTNNGAAVSSGQFVTAADIAAGSLQFTPAPDVNGAACASFTFQVEDDGGTANGGVDLDQSPNTITADVISVNDAPAGTDKTATTLEDAAYTFTAADFGFSDPHDSPVNILSAVKITALPTAGTLTNSGVAVAAGQFISLANINSGKLKFAPAANANGLNCASFTFQVQDDGGTANGGVDLDQSPNAITINVTSVNDAPAGTSTTVTTLEDTPYTFAVSDFGFSDPNDSPANNLLAVKITTFATSGSLKDNGVAVSAGQFVSASDIAAGLLQFSPAPDANGAACASFTFQVQDDGGTANGGIDLDQSPNTITVNVISVNDAPAGADRSVTTLEDTAYTFTTADFGFSDPHDSPANNLLAVKITTLPAAGTLTDNGVAVTAGQFVSASDIAAGLLKFTPAADANGATYASLTFQVQDDGGTANGGVDLDQSPNTITVNVISVNDAPAGADRMIATLEDTAYTFTAADFGFSDPHDSPANNLLAVKIGTLPTAGTLADNGVAVTAGQFVSAADIAAGLLKFSPAANANGASYASFNFQVQDDGGTANGGVDLDQSPNAITIDATPVNDPPVGANKTVTTLEDTPYTFTVGDFGFSDPNDSPANNLLAVKITTLPAAGTLTDNGVAVSAGQFVSAADIAAGVLTFTPAADANGASYASFTFQVQDDGGTANGGVDLDPSPNAITVNVIPVNDAPAGADKTITTLEDTAYSFTAADFGFSDSHDSPANSLMAVKISRLPTAGKLTDNGVAVAAGQFISVTDISAGLLKFTPAADANGASYASFAFQVQDNGGTANGGADLDQSPNTIMVNVTSVNDAPSGADAIVTTVEGTAYTFKVADFGFSDPHDLPANKLLAVRISASPAHGKLTVNGVAVAAGQFVSAADVAAGKLKFTPAANEYGQSYASFKFQVQDDGGTANGGVNLDPIARTITVNVTSLVDSWVQTRRSLF